MSPASKGAAASEPFLRNLAVEAMLVLSKCNRFFNTDVTEVLEAFQEVMNTSDQQSLYNTFCDRLELQDEPFLTVSERRNGETIELRLPYLDRLETQAITQK